MAGAVANRSESVDRGGVPLSAFYDAHERALGYLPDPEKRQAIDAAPDDPLYLIAGPGTGKTACLAVRVLKLLFVDGVPPRGIVATTFTNKAAAELRSRILGLGYQLGEELARDVSLSEAARAWISSVDVNQIVTGTIDSLCADLLTLYRPPGTQPPVEADEYVAATLMLREGLFKDYRYNSKRLSALLMRLDGRGTSDTFGWHIARKAAVCSSLADRRVHDQVNMEGWVAAGSDDDDRHGRDRALKALDAYDAALAERGMLDFAGIEQEALRRLTSGMLSEFLAEVEVVLVDEYQDTNLLQEQLYFALAGGCAGALTVVGDDEQSLYRFRGATVELFLDFANRYKKRFRRGPTTVYLRTNHRSTPEIVDFVQNYATLDPKYRQIRAKGKPKLLPAIRHVEPGLPVLAMFRDSVAELATDLAGLVADTFNGVGYRLPTGQSIRGHKRFGDIGDAALLCFSPSEAEGRLPALLRAALLKEKPAIELFNPRGEEVADVDVVARFAGAVLECLDPGGKVQGAMFLTSHASGVFDHWRDAARLYLKGTPELASYVKAWEARRKSRRWPREVSALELLYAIAHWFPDLHDDPEGQLYLELFARQLNAAEQLSRYSGQVVTDASAKPNAQGMTVNEWSVKDLLDNFLAPIANGLLTVNEDLVEDFPRHRMSVLSIHQAKGLEFPLVIVDVGSRFKTDHRTQRGRRFPAEGGAPQAMEDSVRPHSPLGKPGRSAVDRAFDDLYRQYFVAFSRARNVLVLAGLRSATPGGSIPNVALGWTRNGDSRWASSPPYEEI